MATELKIRRDVDGDITSNTPAEGEIWYNITTKRLHIGDAVLVGGTMLPNIFDAQKLTAVAALASGTDTLTVTLAPAPAAYTTYQIVVFETPNANIGSVTLNVNSLGAKTLKKNGGADNLVANDLIAGGVYVAIYDGTVFQLITAIGGSAVGLQSFQVFTTSGTWTKPSDVKNVRAVVIGGGGNGGSGATSNGAGGGGAAGGVAEEFIDVTGTSSETVTVGAAGGTSSLGALLSATGGANGANATSGASGLGGTGGVGSSGNINAQGADGASGSAGNGGSGGTGGSSFYGGGARGSTTGTGDAAGNYGSGGGGGFANQTGGAGSGGIVIVWEYK
jgi:hypothetical protein